jgi:predicted ATPase
MKIESIGYAENFSKEGENLAMVTEFFCRSRRHPDIFQKIIEKLKQRIPGISQVDSKITEEGRVLLRFKDGDFHDPFLARYVSDGTIKMFAYLILLYDPKPHPLLSLEEQITTYMNEGDKPIKKEAQLYDKSHILVADTELLSDSTR